MRTREQIDVEYNAVVKAYGDTIFKMNMHQQAIQEQVKALHQKLTDLANEPVAPSNNGVEREKQLPPSSVL